MSINVGDVVKFVGQKTQQMEGFHGIVEYSGDNRAIVSVHDGDVFQHGFTNTSINYDIDHISKSIMISVELGLISPVVLMNQPII